MPSGRWERAKKGSVVARRDFIIRTDSHTHSILNPKESSPLLGPASLMTGKKHTLQKIEDPKFTWKHALYNDGRGLAMYKVIGVYSHRVDGPELLRLQDMKTGLPLKSHVSAHAVQGARVVNPRT